MFLFSLVFGKQFIFIFKTGNYYDTFALVLGRLQALCNCQLNEFLREELWIFYTR